MFWNWFKKKPERQREIFTYWDGQKARAGDPISLYRDLKDDKEFNIDVHPSLVDAGDLDAYRIMSAAVRRAFDIKPLSQGGLTETECIALAIEYFDWTDAVKKKLSPPVTSPESTDTMPPLESSATPTSLPSDSSSIGTGPNSETPTEPR